MEYKDNEGMVWNPINEVTQADVTEIGNQIMATSLLPSGWSWRYMTLLESTTYMPDAMAATLFVTSEVVVNPAYVPYFDRDGAENAFRHELAHVLAGPTAGHGLLWQVMAIRVGADPTSHGLPNRYMADHYARKEMRNV